MTFWRLAAFRGIVIATAMVGPVAVAQQHEHHPAADTPKAAMQESKTVDTRQVVSFPRKIKEHQLMNMREHLLSVSRIQELLSQHEFDKAADVAEKRLGLSSFEVHGAHEIAPYMPKGMREAGEAMHRAASQFAIAT